MKKTPQSDGAMRRMTSVAVFLEATQPRFLVATSALAGIATLSKALDSLSALGPQKSPIVMVDLAGDLDRGLRTLAEVRSSVPGVQLIAVADSKDPEVILPAMRAGAREFAVLGDGRELAAIVEGLQKRASAEDPGGSIVSVFPAKGGVGATTVAANLAGALTSQGKRVLLVDLDRRLGDVLVFMDMTARYSIGDVVKNLHRLDRELLLSSLGRHRSGTFVLAHSESLDDDEAVGVSKIIAALQFAARHFDYIVCDGMRGFNELSVAVLDASARVELVLTQDVVALKNAKRCVEICNRLGYADDKIDLVVNRFSKKAPIDVWAIAENVGHDVGSTLANDYPAAVAAVNRGILLGEAAPRSRLTRDIAELAARVSGAPLPQQRGFFGRLFGGSEAPRPKPQPVKPSNEREGPAYDVARRTSQTS